jgi:hypothetical protein
LKTIRKFWENKYWTDTKFRNRNHSEKQVLNRTSVLNWKLSAVLAKFRNFTSFGMIDELIG